MYYETSIGKLSKVQLNNLLKGKRVRVKKGTAHKINLTQEQLYKFNHNTSKGKALTIKLNQDQIAKQGSGIIGHLVGKIHPGVGKLANMIGLGMKQKKGRGLAADLIGLVHPTAGKLASIVGLGAQKKTYRPKTLGAGFIEDLAKQAAVNLAKTAGKFAVDKSLELGGNYVKGKIEGLGLKEKNPSRKTGRKATPAQLAALARGRATRDANRLAKMGGALYVA